VEGDHAKMVSVKRRIGDDNFWKSPTVSRKARNHHRGVSGHGRDLEDGKKSAKRRRRGTPKKP